MTMVAERNRVVEDDLELDLDLDLDFDFMQPLRSRTSPKKGKKKKASKKPQKPQPWDDDWYDPEDSL